MTREEELKAIRESNGKMGVIYTVAMDSEGKVVLRGCQSSADPHRDHHLMSSFLLFNEQSIKGSCLLKDYKLGNILLTTLPKSTHERTDPLEGMGDPGTLDFLHNLSMALGEKDTIDTAAKQTEPVGDCHTLENGDCIALNKCVHGDGLNVEQLYMRSLHLEDQLMTLAQAVLDGDVSTIVNNLQTQMRLIQSKRAIEYPNQINGPKWVNRQEQADNDAAGKRRLIEALQLDSGEQRWSNIMLTVDDLILARKAAVSVIEMTLAYTAFVQRGCTDRDFGEPAVPAVEKCLNEWINQHKPSTERYRIWPDKTTQLITQSAIGADCAPPDYLSDDFKVFEAVNEAEALNLYSQWELASTGVTK